jgi:hypothetical protein
MPKRESQTANVCGRVADLIEGLGEIYTREGVHIWLTGRHRLLGDRTPLDVMRDEGGLDRVEALLAYGGDHYAADPLGTHISSTAKDRAKWSDLLDEDDLAIIAEDANPKTASLYERETKAQVAFWREQFFGADSRVAELKEAIRDAIENIESDVYLNAVDALDTGPMIAAIVETKQRLKAAVGDV